MLRITMVLLLAGLTLATQANGEVVYVDDTLRVGVRKSPGNNEAPIEVISSGETLEVLERVDGHLRVRTPRGAEGWVGNVYVRPDPPARVQIQRIKEENERLRAQLVELRGGATVEQEMARLTAQAETLQQEKEALQRQIEEIQASNDRALRVDPSIGAGLLVALLGLGTYLGIRRERRRVARRFNGLEF